MTWDGVGDCGHLQPGAGACTDCKIEFSRRMPASHIETLLAENHRLHSDLESAREWITQVLTKLKCGTRFFALKQLDDILKREDDYYKLIGPAAEAMGYLAAKDEKYSKEIVEKLRKVLPS